MLNWGEVNTFNDYVGRDVRIKYLREDYKKVNNLRFVKIKHE